MKLEIGILLGIIISLLSTIIHIFFLSRKLKAVIGELTNYQQQVSYWKRKALEHKD